jgi:hypothetical protein
MESGGVTGFRSWQQAITRNWTAGDIYSKQNQEATLPTLHFTTAPNWEEAYRVGDQVEVYCDHERDGIRVRDWLIGTVVQVDSKLLAVQFQQNVYLTDGWMVPDQVLWFPKESSHLRKPVRRRHKTRPRTTKAG